MNVNSKLFGFTLLLGLFLSCGNKPNPEKEKAYQEATGEGRMASDCVACRQCEKACPQHLPITDYLKKGADMLEG